MKQHLFTYTVTPDTTQHVYALAFFSTNKVEYINIISVLTANQSLDVTCLALADRTQKSLARVSVLAGHYLKFWHCVCKPGIKINSVYYCDNIFEQGLLPDIRYLSNDDFHFQQDGALAHRSRHAHYRLPALP